MFNLFYYQVIAYSKYKERLEAHGKGVLDLANRVHIRKFIMVQH